MVPKLHIFSMNVEKNFKKRPTRFKIIKLYKTYFISMVFIVATPPDGICNDINLLRSLYLLSYIRPTRVWTMSFQVMINRFA